MREKTPPANKPPADVGHRGLGGLLRSRHGDPDAFGSERSFSPEIGDNWSPDEPPRGFYMDFSFKAESPNWPPVWLAPLSEQLHVATIQWGLGAYERFLKGEDEEWLRAAYKAGEHMLGVQHCGGPQDGGWRHFFSMPHTYRVDPPWVSSIAQGEGASLLVRLYLQTREERFAAAARRALLPMSVPSAEGGTLAHLESSPFLEEYPTDPPSFVLNGALFALWGFRDVGAGLDDQAALATFEELTSALANNIHRWDTGSWSRYDLHPHPVRNLASPAYHLLHIRQLEILDRLSSHSQLREVKGRFQEYRSSAKCRRKATAHKVAFRLAVPRNAMFARRLPWHTTPKPPGARGTGTDVVVLGYHAVSADWSAPLSVTPESLDWQLGYLKRRGYSGVTFADAVADRGAGKRVAITFDDGYRSVVSLAQPILEAHGMPGTVFVPTDHLGTEQPMSWPGIDHWLDGPHADELMPMSWEEARRLIDFGWEIGSHTCSHPRLPELDDEMLRRELEDSRAECERHLARPCESLAYPYGQHDARVMEAAMRAGYSAAAALGAEWRPASFRWPRVGVYHADGNRSFRLKASRSMRGVRHSRAWPLLRGAAGRFRHADPPSA